MGSHPGPLGDDGRLHGRDPGGGRQARRHGVRSFPGPRSSRSSCSSSSWRRRRRPWIPDLVWSRVPMAQRVLAPAACRRASSFCDVCELVVRPSDALRDGDRLRCPRCTDVLHRRKPQSLQRTWALLIAAVVCYIPANLLPIMTVTSLGRSQSDTIFSGVSFMLDHGMWPLALVIFTPASSCRS
jgi:hypothetical protein